ncbi:hypothetical protein ACQPXM_37290 [Kribbella sp. CA-253562]|uniref:hypothetical protein n=1 Tax=Kribbella sp. CA-253562 TaxID=3239942 RepID=UPI003D94CFDD
MRLEIRRESADAVVDDWQRIVADGTHPWFGKGYEGCGIWACCPPTVGVRSLLMMLEPGIRRPDREVLFAELRWVESLA